MKKASALFLAVLLCVTTLSALPIRAETAGANLINDRTAITLNTPAGKAEIKDGTFSMKMVRDCPYIAVLSVPGLTDRFTVSGILRVDRVIDTGDNDVSIWNGIRILCGRKSDGEYNTVSLYRNVGIQVVNHSTVGIGAIYPYDPNVTFADGCEYPFELTRKGSRVTFSLDGSPVLDYTFAAGEDMFTPFSAQNIGFVSINTDFTILNFTVKNNAGSADREETTVTEEPIIYDTEKNLIDMSTSISGAGKKAEWKDGVLTAVNRGTYFVNFDVPGLSDSFTWSFRLHIDDISDDGDISGWNGLRFVCGRKSTDLYNTVTIYRTYGAQVVNNSAIGLGDLRPLKGDAAMVNGEDIDVKICRRGNRFVLYLNGETTLDYTISDGDDLFTIGGSGNIGIMCINTGITVTDMELHNDDSNIEIVIRKYIRLDDRLPVLTFDGITQEQFADAFEVLEEALVTPASNSDVYGFRYPFCGPGGAYGACWWQLDTSLAMLGTRWSSQTIAENTIRNFMLVQQENGRIALHGPDTLLDENNKCSSLPKLFTTAYEIVKGSSDRQLIEDTYTLLKRYLNWWLTCRYDEDMGLVWGIVEESLPGTNTYEYHVETNVEVAVGCRVVSELAVYLGYADDAKEYGEWLTLLTENINRKMYNSTQGRYEGLTQSGTFNGIYTVAVFNPLRLGSYSDERTETILAVLTDQNLFNWDTNPLTSAAKTDPKYNETDGVYAAIQWYGSIWSLRNCDVIDGLEAIGRFDLSSYLTLRTVQLFNDNYTEFLNPTTGSGEGVQRYSWTAAQYIDLIICHIFGIDYNKLTDTLTICPNVDSSLYGKTLKIGNVGLPNGCRLSVTVQAEQNSVTIDYDVDDADRMDGMRVVVGRCTTDAGVSAGVDTTVEPYAYGAKIRTDNGCFYAGTVKITGSDAVKTLREVLPSETEADTMAETDSETVPVAGDGSDTDPASSTDTGDAQTDAENDTAGNGCRSSSASVLAAAIAAGAAAGIAGKKKEDD